MSNWTRRNDAPDADYLRYPVMVDYFRHKDVKAIGGNLMVAWQRRVEEAASRSAASKSEERDGGARPAVTRRATAIGTSGSYEIFGVQPRVGESK